MFHAKDGFYFQRQEDSSVQIIVRESGQSEAAVVKEITLGPTEWASVVASMSKAGENGETWRAALRAQAGDEAAAPYEPKAA